MNIYLMLYVIQKINFFVIAVAQTELWPSDTFSG